jgi:bis(5'-nucleosyl)-tetraphosphatase (symmetrical)
MTARRIFIGDIQGCREELETLLERCRFDPGTDVLHPVGDLVNRGPDSLGALRLLRELDARPVLGNHDLHLLRTAAGRRSLAAGDTLDEVLAADDRDALLDWVAAQPFLRVFDDLYLVHAGLHPRWSEPAAALAGLDPLERHPASDFATRVRLCDPDGAFPPPAAVGSSPAEPPAGFAPWDAYFRPADHGERRVVFGHWAARGLVRTESVIGLDTGCVWGGSLTAWIAEERRIVSVPARRQWQQPDRD